MIHIKFNIFFNHFFKHCLTVWSLTHLIFAVFFTNILIAQNAVVNKSANNEIDSMLHVLESSLTDTMRVKTLNRLSRKYSNISNLDAALKHAYEAKKLAEKVDFKIGLASSCNTIGGIYSEKGDLAKSLEFILIALRLSEENNFLATEALSYTLIGNAYLGKEENKLALENYNKSLNIRKTLNDTIGIAACYNNIGIIYKNLGDNDEALKNYEKCLSIFEELNSKTENKDNIRAIASILNNIGMIHFNKKNYSKALQVHLRALKLKEQMEFKLGIASSCDNIGMVFTKLHKFDEAYKYFMRALEINKAVGAKIRIKECYDDMVLLYVEKGDYKTALEYRKLYNQIKDSILNEESGKQIAEMNIKYDSEKKDKELIQKETELKKQLSESDKRRVIRNSLGVGFVFILIATFVVLRNYNQKRRANKLLQEKNDLIEKQKIIVENKNDKITASISYAKKIQQATLPSEESIKRFFSDAFVLFMPRDIVSGDFYWYSEIETVDEKIQIFALADCTGHGVPGAFMSMIGNTQLNEIINVKKKINPSEILNELNTGITKLLNQKKDDINSQEDGMDISIILFRKRKDRPTKINIRYACANHSIYIVDNDGGRNLKGDIYSVGGMFGNTNVEFHEQELDADSGTKFYLFSDGYVDQFGGEKNSKFSSRRFEELILSIHQKTFQEQNQIFADVIKTWKGTNKQLDDILIVGLKL